MDRATFQSTPPAHSDKGLEESPTPSCVELSAGNQSQTIKAPQNTIQ